MLHETEWGRERANAGNKIAESIHCSGLSGFLGSNNLTKCPICSLTSSSPPEEDPLRAVMLTVGSFSSRCSQLDWISLMTKRHWSSMYYEDLNPLTSVLFAATKLGSNKESCYIPQRLVSLRIGSKWPVGFLTKWAQHSRLSEFENCFPHLSTQAQKV